MKVSGEIAKRIFSEGGRVGDVVIHDGVRHVCVFYPGGDDATVWVPLDAPRDEGYQVYEDCEFKGTAKLVEIGRTDLFITEGRGYRTGYTHSIVKTKRGVRYSAGCRWFDSRGAGAKHWGVKHWNYEHRDWERKTNNKLWREAKKRGWKVT